MVTIKKQKIKSVGGDVEKLEPLCTVHGNGNGAATMKTNGCSRDKIMIWSSNSICTYVTTEPTHNGPVLFSDQDITRT